MATLSHSSPTHHHQTPSSPSLLSPSPLPFSVLRLWRPQAQRNLRNQWSKLNSLRQQWFSSSSNGRSHATSLVNSYLELSNVDAMDLGVLSDMPNIRKKASCKLMKQLKLHRDQLLSSYKAMAAVVVDMMNSSRSMRCFLKSNSGSPLVQFSSNSEDSTDSGDGGGITVFTFLSMSAFEMLAGELVDMFKWELILKRVLVVELLSFSCQKIEQLNQVSWTDDLYPGEADDLKMCNLYSEEDSKLFLPRIKGWGSKSASLEFDKQPSHNILLVLLTTWLVEANIDTYRVEEIFAIVGEEIRTSFS